MLTTLHSLSESMVLQKAYYLALSFDWDVDKVIMMGVRIFVVTTFR